MVVLALASASVLVVIDRSVVATADLALRMQAFEVARDNMEELLTLDNVHEQTEYGASERYPDIEFQTVVEIFNEPATSKMWVRGVCTAQYVDTEGETKTVELTHWLTNLTDEQVQKIREIREMEKERLIEAEQLLATIEEAAEYCGVDTQTIQAWAQLGMPKTADGSYIKLYLDLYFDYDGYPPPQAREEADLEYKTLTGHDIAPAPQPGAKDIEPAEGASTEEPAEELLDEPGEVKAEPDSDEEPDWEDLFGDM